MLGEMKSEETEIIRRVTRSEDPLCDNLLSSIPNEVTLQHIFTMLPRGDYEAVATVNRDWQRAFQGRMVYDARSFTASTMPLTSIDRAFSVGQQFFACLGFMATPRDHLPVSDEDIDTKFVVTVGDRGPKLIKTRDEDAEDDMDRLHEMFANQLVGQHVLRDEFPPAESLASKIRHHEQRALNSSKTSFFGFYDPVNDEWREFEKAILGTDNVDDDGPKYFFDLWPMTRVDYATDDFSDDDGPIKDGDLDKYPTVSVWSMSL